MKLEQLRLLNWRSCREKTIEMRPQVADFR